MSGALQAVFQNQRSFIPPLPAAIGAAFGGGFFAGQISTAGNGIADYNLVIGPVASAQNSSKKFSTNAANDPGATSVIDGPSNSSSMNDGTHPAAQFCEGLTIGGFSDWYMPAKNELAVCYVNLKPTTTNNTTSTGINPNSVPARASNYTTGNPARTSSAAFQSGGAEAFSTANNYWSSTQGAYTSTAFSIYFNNGFLSDTDKRSDYYVRAIRRVAV